MNIHEHSIISAKRFGGIPSDYDFIHAWFDQFKLHLPDVRHRSLLHHSGGISLCEQVHGFSFTRASDLVILSTRPVAENHIFVDMGCIPEPSWYLRELPVRNWHMGNISPSQRHRLRMLSIDEFIS